MAITTVDGLVAGFTPRTFFYKTGATMEAAGVHHSLFYTAGIPGAAAVPTSTIDGDALTSYAGQIPFSNPGSGNSYLAGFTASTSSIAAIMLVDRLWHNANINVTTTTAQAITTPTFPARDRNGATNGVDVMVGIEVSTATTNGAAVTNTTLDYTNSAGTSGRTATIPSTMPGGGLPATAVAGTFVPFQLAAGDVGVRSIQGLTLGTSYGGGTIHLVAYRVLARMHVTVASSGAALNMVETGMMRLYDNTVPFLVLSPTATTAINAFGDMLVAQG